MVGGGCDSSYYRKLKTEWWKQLGAILLAMELAASHCNYSCILCRTTSGRSRGRRPLIFRPNWGPKGQKTFLETRPYLKVCISHWVHYGNFLVLIDVKNNSPRLSPVKPFQATRKAVVQRITKNSLRKSYICLLLKYPLLYQLCSLKVKKNFYFSGIVNGLKPEVIPLIGQFSRDFIGHLSVKPWCHWVWRVYMWLVRFNCNLCLKCLLCGLTQKNKN